MHCGAKLILKFSNYSQSSSNRLDLKIKLVLSFFQIIRKAHQTVLTKNQVASSISYPHFIGSLPHFLR